MNKRILGLVSVVSLWTTAGIANEAVKIPLPAKEQTSQTSTVASFTPAQKEEIEKVVVEYLGNHPELIMASFQAGMEKQQKEAVVKMEKAVAENKDKVFNDKASPVEGNPTGTETLVVFTDPNCGYCKKFHEELVKLLKINKDVKVIYKDVALMGPDSKEAIKAMIAAKEQGKYTALKDAIYSSKEHLTKDKILKLAKSLGINVKKLKTAMESKTVEDQVNRNVELATTIGVNGTPTLIIGEKVLPGYVALENLNKLLKEASAPTEIMEIETASIEESPASNK